MEAFDSIFPRCIARLEENLPSYLYYHNVAHTLHVLNKSIVFAHQQDVLPAELEVLKLAALYHDTGFMVQRFEHEQISCELARRDLKELGYETNVIDSICGIIMATKIPQQPQSNLEKILADADLEYLGTTDYDMRSECLFKEMKHFDTSIKMNDWIKFQIDFLEKHSFHTEFCINVLEPIKQLNLNKLKEKAISKYI
ncbi:HD domain-containing protein [Anditalea andensis]|uniref:HD/PDEase domain-containing protein n=1 Tax=Anditalea andensis TaxID=1048983 RepID=A0A074KU16_9BACT|nr:HD domain-containing protein [Anditalea andensis]KEO71750.1 hypothetical protein EL17_21430 [Anditalea andensis]